MNMIRKNISVWRGEMRKLKDMLKEKAKVGMNYWKSWLKKSYKKNKSPEIIAEELEEDISVIENIITKLTR